jgi:hypothetical protein
VQQGGIHFALHSEKASKEVRSTNTLSAMSTYQQCHSRQQGSHNLLEKVIGE